MKICFLGHRIIFKNIREKIKNELLKQIELGYNQFYIGFHGDFDKLALSVCREIYKENKNIEINVVMTSIRKLQKDEYGYSIQDSYPEVHFITYDFEDIYYKKQITYTNQKMIDECDMVICYIDPAITKSGAKSAVEYARKNNKKIVNLFDLIN